MRLFATKSPDGLFVTVGRTVHEAEDFAVGALGLWRREGLRSVGFTVVPVTLTELPAESEERRG